MSVKLFAIGQLFIIIHIEDNISDSGMKNVQKLYVTEKELPNLILLTLKQNLFYFISGVVFVTIITSTAVYMVFKHYQSNTIVAKEEITKPQPTAQPAILVKTYTVKEGEGLWDIALRVYGDGEMMNEIIKANNIYNPDLITAGDTIILPKIGKVEPSRSNVAGVHTSQVTYIKSTYIVQEGEGLWQIAERAYGDGNAWYRIAKANHIDNPDMVAPGTKLKLPR